MTQSTLDFIKDPGVLFTHPRKNPLELKDLFVFPDMEEFTEKVDTQFIPSNKAQDYLLSNEKVIIFGSINSGNGYFGVAEPPS